MDKKKENRTWVNPKYIKFPKRGNVFWYLTLVPHFLPLSSIKFSCPMLIIDLVSKLLPRKPWLYHTDIMEKNKNNI